MNMKYHVILWSMFISQTFGLFTSENVVFQKTNEVYINDVYWIVTFVHDLRPFTNLINQISNDLSFTDEIIGVITKSYRTSNMTGYLATFESLHVEVSLLTDTYMSVFDSFQEYKALSMNTTMHKRSILPILGELMHTLIGTLSEKDLENINNNINVLATNQERIIHDLDISLSVLNLTAKQVAENRRSIMDLVKVIQKLDSKIRQLQQSFEQKFVRLEQFIHTYLQFQMILDEIRITTQDAVFYLQSLKTELNMLSMHHLSTYTISPHNLKKLLIVIESKLPNNVELPRNPRKDIWYYYKTLACMTYLQSKEIRIVLKIPLINTKESYEVFKVHNLPLPSDSITSNQTNVLLKYELEAEMLIVSKDKTTFSILSDYTYRMCTNHHYQFCNPETAFYQTNINKLCIMALFMESTHDLKALCKMQVVFETLPITRHLTHGIWIVTTDKPLTFTVTCRSNELKTNDLKIKPPFGIIKLNETCKASNKYLQLPAYFGQNSYFERIDPLQALLKLHNLSKFSVGNITATESFKSEKINIPSHLISLKEVPLQHFLKETRHFNVLRLNSGENKINWTFVIIISIALIVFVILIIWLIMRKGTCLNEIIGRKLANVHGSEREEAKQSPSFEDIEMSTMVNSKIVHNDSEGQSTSFKRTDAMMAWK